MIDMTRDHSLYPDCGYDHKYDHRCSLHTGGVSVQIVEWCAEHCEGKWGWYFNHVPYLADPYSMKNNAILTFELQSDLVAYAITH
jgi:hypothetical protein